MKKYQFYISFNDKKNTASSKAIDDCTQLLTDAGYESFNIRADLHKKRYLFTLIGMITRLCLTVPAKSYVAIQYPLLSGNSLFKYVVMALRLRKVRFFCVVHDLDELRHQTNVQSIRSSEAALLNYYDCIIVHNEVMRRWLLQRGVRKPMIELGIFDYLVERNKSASVNEIENVERVENLDRVERFDHIEQIDTAHNQNRYTAVFAGNLSKSGFVYQLNSVPAWHFNLYGPNFAAAPAVGLNNVSWKGSFNPQEILHRMEGAFGLIWDGEKTEVLDELYGNYLYYNNPHKFSLYLAAGLPIIAPRLSAIGKIVEKHGLGILIDRVEDLQTIQISSETYNAYKKQVAYIGDKLRRGQYFKTAIAAAENHLEQT